ncbi:DNA phosphorothioation system sulfurtransferase DndC [Flavobacterium sp. TBRC 19031]|uniref:DNA phosphorothioation system sulfurtransferase DndC n=1 Tax=Flavobacterium mekongense TaxID=3379707 RepID=UPI00399A5973
MSVFDKKTLNDIYKEIQDTYKTSSLPWVIGYSGGKDSTATLQLIWNAIVKLPVEERTKPIHVISTDTLVETPVIVNYISSAIQKMNAAAKEQQLNLTAHTLTPELQDTFWVNLIGKGYPAPNTGFRWCTDRMKINPSNKFILEKVAEHGEVILALGMRRNESANRNKVIDNHEVKGYKLSRHGKLRGAWVFMPVEEFTTDDIWTYLLNQPISPWGMDNRHLSALYRSAQSGECPLVVDDSTPSCGNSRFGCWTCTVVSKDKSMEAMIDSGEEWMTPLLDFRDWLSSTQNPEVKPLQREFRGRDGRIKISETGKLRYRTYKLEFSKEMFKRLLETERLVKKHDPKYELISLAEIAEIRRIWISERQDWNDELPDIYQNITGKELAGTFSDIFVPGATELSILYELSEEHDVPMQLLQRLLDAEWQSYGMFRRASIHSTIEKIFEKDWRTLEDIQHLITQPENNDTE